MSFDRKELAGAIASLHSNANWRHYVNTLEAHYNSKVNQLLDTAHPDEALRGECRALRDLLKNINRHNGDLT